MQATTLELRSSYSSASASDEVPVAARRRPIRVLSVLNKLVWAGHEQRLLQLAEQIDRARFEHQVLVITAPQFEDPDAEKATGSMRHAFDEIGYPVVDLGEPHDPVCGRVGWLRAIRGMQGMTRVVRRLVRHIRDQRIDVIDAHHTSAIFAAAIAGRITRVPVIISAYHVEPWKPLVMRIPGQLAFGLSSGVVTDSLARATEISDWLWKRSTPIDVIPTGVPIPQATRPMSEVRRELGLPDDESVPVIGQLSGRIPCKGHDVLIEAAPHILKDFPRAHFLCVGFSRSQHDYEASLQSRVTALGLQERFHFRSYAGPMGDVWPLFEVLAHPSKFDSLPLSILEAMAVGKAIVSTSVGGIPEVIRHGENGWLVPPHDPLALAQGLVHVLSHPELKHRLGSAARSDHRASLTPQKMARSLEAIYARLAEPR